MRKCINHNYPVPFCFFAGEGVEGGDCLGGLEGGGVSLRISLAEYND